MNHRTRKGVNMSAKSKPDTRWGVFFSAIYPVSVMFFIGERKEMAETIADAMSGPDCPDGELRKEFIEKVRSQYGVKESGVAGECICVAASNGVRLWIVRINKFRGSISEMGMLSHECLHVALSVLDFCGVVECPPCEALCYAHQAMFEKFLTCASAHIGLLRPSPAKK